MRMKTHPLLPYALVSAGLFFLIRSSRRNRAGLNGLGAGPTPAVSAHVARIKKLEADIKVLNGALKVARQKASGGSSCKRDARKCNKSAMATGRAEVLTLTNNINQAKAELAALKSITVYTDQNGNAYMPDEYQAIMNRPVVVTPAPAPTPSTIKVTSPGGVAPYEPPSKAPAAPVVTDAEADSWLNAFKNMVAPQPVAPQPVAPAPAQIIQTPAPQVVVHHQPAPSAAAAAQPQSSTSSLQPLLMIGTVAAVPLIMGMLGD